MDIYSDHMVRNYERNGIPLERIDNTAFMVGKTGTCYGRGTAAWKGMLVLSLGRGNLMNTYYGNLELIDNAKAKWFAKAQKLFLPLQEGGRFTTFGGVPGKSEGYGYTALGTCGALQTVVNPSQSVMKVELPALAGVQGKRILFSDSGFKPLLKGSAVVLGPEQLCVVGRGEYASAMYELGVEEDVQIPFSIKKLDVKFKADGSKSISCTMKPPAMGCLRIVMKQHERGIAFRTTGGCPPNGRPMGQILSISVEQAGKKVSVVKQYDKAIWSGLSWAVAEVKASDLKPGVPLKIVCSTEEKWAVSLVGEIYSIVK